MDHVGLTRWHRESDWKVMPDNARAAPASQVLEAERLRRQRGRSIAIALSLLGLVALFYIATLVKMGGLMEKAG